MVEKIEPNESLKKFHKKFCQESPIDSPETFLFLIKKINEKNNIEQGGGSI